MPHWYFIETEGVAEGILLGGQPVYLRKPIPVITKNAGLLHDIGKVKIPDQILNAPRKLTPEEVATVKHHPIYSDEMLPADCDEKVRSAVRHHHEKLCGGYPDNLGQEQISLFARITAISDIYDTMVSRRSYKSSVIAFQVLGLLMEGHLQELTRNWRSCS